MTYGHDYEPNDLSNFNIYLREVIDFPGGLNIDSFLDLKLGMTVTSVWPYT